MRRPIALLAVLAIMLVGANPDDVDRQPPRAGEFRLRAKLPAHQGAAYCVAFRPGGKVLASGGSDKKVRLWDVRTGKPAATLEGHQGTIWAAAFHPDGKTLVTGSGRYDPARQQYVSGEVHVWDVPRARLQAALDGHTGLVNSLAFSPDGKLLASTGEDATVKLWDMKDEMPGPPRILYDHAAIPVGLRRRGPDAIMAVAFSPDGKLLAWGDCDCCMNLWDVPAGEEKARWEPQAGPIRALAFSPDNRTLASAAYDFINGGGNLKLWDVATGTVRATLAAQPGGFHAVAFRRDGGALLSGSNGGVVMRWDLKTNKGAIVHREEDVAVYDLKFSPDGGLLAAARSDGSVLVWDAMPVAKPGRE
jgi:WD40 repeat protein